MKRTRPLQRKTPLAIRTAIARTSKLRPVSKKRAATRRKPNGIEAFHMARIAALPCLVSGKVPVTVHHVTASIHGGRIARSDRRVVPLAVEYHQHDHGKLSVERLGHGGFYETHGIDLLAEADRLWRETMGIWISEHGLTTAAQLEAAQ